MTAATLPDRLLPAWNVAAWVIWNALDEDDAAYDIAAAVVGALSARDLLNDEAPK